MEIIAFGTTNSKGFKWRSLISGSLIKVAFSISVTDPVISAGRLCIQQRLSGSLDGDRFVSTTAAVSTLRAVAIPPFPGRQKHNDTGCVTG